MGNSAIGDAGWVLMVLLVLLGELLGLAWWLLKILVWFYAILFSSIYLTTLSVRLGKISGRKKCGLCVIGCGFSREASFLLFPYWLPTPVCQSGKCLVIFSKWKKARGFENSRIFFILSVKASGEFADRILFSSLGHPRMHALEMDCSQRRKLQAILYSEPILNIGFTWKWKNSQQQFWFPLTHPEKNLCSRDVESWNWSTWQDDILKNIEPRLRKVSQV